MTMRIVAKFYPITDDDVVKAKDALEQIKRDVLAPRGAYIGGTNVIETTEEFPGSTMQVKVVKFDNYVHLDK